ncbi:hypothetical protein Tco_1164689 [Tanacetum coccineum]
MPLIVFSIFVLPIGLLLRLYCLPAKNPESFVYLPLSLLVKLMASGLLIPDWKLKFIFVRERFFSNKCPGIMTLRDFLQYPGNHHISVAAVPFRAAISGRNSADPPIEAYEGRFGSFSSGSTGFIGPLATSEENSDSDSILPGDEAVHEARDILSKFDHERFVMASNMLNREARSLSSVVLKLHETVFMLKGEQSVSSAIIARIELVQSSKDILECDAVTLRSQCRKFDEKEAIMVATEASLKAEIKSLKEKHDSAMEDYSLVVTDLLPHVAFEELVGMGLDFQLKDMKDYEPDVVDSFDKPIDNFYRVEFPYLNLLAYHARKSLGLLKSL